jgi:peptidoglycan/LPS O-acetylase OafA/YrhL
MYMVHYFIREWIKMLISVNSNSSPVWWLFLYLIVMLGLSYMLYRFLEIPARKYLSSLFLPNRIPIGIYQHSK